jgi:hypothetical protein
MSATAMSATAVSATAVSATAMSVSDFFWISGVKQSLGRPGPVR